MEFPILKVETTADLKKLTFESLNFQDHTQLFDPSQHKGIASLFQRYRHTAGIVVFLDAHTNLLAGIISGSNIYGNVACELTRRKNKSFKTAIIVTSTKFLPPALKEVKKSYLKFRINNTFADFEKG